jgi:hypothetical protein
MVDAIALVDALGCSVRLVRLGNVTINVTYLRFLLVDLQLPHGVHDVTPAHNCVPLKYAPSAPSADFHNDSFGNPSTTKIPSGCPAEVMEDQAGVLGSLA